MHTLQKLLITRLIKHNGLSYAELTKGYDSEDNIVFHLKQLTSKGFVEKQENKYFLTPDGVTTLNTFQKTDLQDNSFKMTFFGFICKCGEFYLIKPHKNTNEAFYNLPSGSPLFGEKLEDALPRTFHEETATYIPFDKFTFDSIHLKTVKTEQGKVLFDDTFIVYSVSVTEKQKDTMDLKKGSIWLSSEEVIKISDKWPEVDMCILRKDWKLYRNYDVICNYIF